VRNMKSRSLLLSGLIAATAIVNACGVDSTNEASANQSAGQSQVDLTQLSANTATEDELQTLPGIGSGTAREIVEHRPYEADTGPDNLREELGKYLPADEVDAIVAQLSFE